jgi:hypothetical protein
MERGQHSDRQRRDEEGEAEPPDPSVSRSGLHDDGTVRMFDPEQFNVTWSEVRPGVDYVPGNFAAQRAGAAVHEVYALFKNGSSLDRLQMMTDGDGHAYLILYLGAELVEEAVMVLRAGFRALGESAGDTV